jgi:transcriptional regulator with XRE-family HTH domain
MYSSPYYAYICINHLIFTIMGIMERLIIERRYRYISQTAMAEHLGITLVTLHRYETGKRSISLELACKYAEKVGFELNLLVKV